MVGGGITVVLDTHELGRASSYDAKVIDSLVEPHLDQLLPMSKMAAFLQRAEASRTPLAVIDEDDRKGLYRPSQVFALVARGATVFGLSAAVIEGRTSAGRLVGQVQGEEVPRGR